MALYYALGNDQFYWIYIYIYKFYFSVKNISVFGYLNALKWNYSFFFKPFLGLKNLLWFASETRVCAYILL